MKDRGKLKQHILNISIVFVFFLLSASNKDPALSPFVAGLVSMEIIYLIQDVNNFFLDGE